MLEFKNIDLKFKDKIIFSNFNFKVSSNEKIVLIGKSGCGKSTLFELALGFKQPDKGKIIFYGEPVTSNSIWKIRKKIAYVDQRVSLPNQKVSHFIDFVFSLKHNSCLKPKNTEIIHCLRLFELNEDIFQKQIDDLSGGEKQRLTLAIAVLLKRKIFFLDEVTSSLDVKLKQKVVEYFFNTQDITVISISHDIEWQKHLKAKIFDVEKKEWIL
ncbi:putative ABC transport system ATP-binding protein [Desulfonauticus submarinus]|uniref:Putative ABC transport system ATP-binding protein n=1 Tax=Desulfonauticus submarinus TaxID=206665 RepID=A0A1H0CF30_9BACT|nr:ABC transporter ATP-binding protein [Desulfonauticus submarinus]SDN56426.1 putative ABC transport system ATP-binding protein [Desulfonauticus submarinus]